MSIKSSFIYQMADHKKAVIIYYFIVIAVFTALLVSIGTSKISIGTEHGGMRLGGLEIASAIFLFVAGLCGFKENFLMLQQNGISRKALFKSRLLVSLLISAGMAVADSILFIIIRWFCTLAKKGLDFESLFEQIYREKAAAMNPATLYFASLLFEFLLCLFLFAAGYFITIMFYRLDKKGKVAVGAGVPIFLNIALPVFDNYIAGGRIGRAIIGFVNFAFGITECAPLNAYVMCTLLFAVLSGFSWLMIRRATVK